MGIDELAGAALMAVLSDPDGTGRSWPAMIVRTRLTAAPAGRGALAALVADPDNAQLRALTRATIAADLAADPAFTTEVRRALGFDGRPGLSRGAVATGFVAVLAVVLMAVGAIEYCAAARAVALRPLEGTWTAQGPNAGIWAPPATLTVGPDHHFRYRAPLGTEGDAGPNTVDCAGDVDTDGDGFVFRSAARGCRTFTATLTADRHWLAIDGATLFRLP
ncbi:hypothetical protein Lfu02_06590 [Longispora fulva]|uniref:Uncharacterized protein n=1 Tax=Longispora fulva TaxID=619741 RepID=A0A8J7KJH5_9ACTN|nr:hypothetical protein [Longispora fulva]MBG6135471.1 hypothetical protein [Longispora fulva]GIG56287.1 hypothetical protein Lfu02_06590 [Longispora fulva]